MILASLINFLDYIKYLSATLGQFSTKGSRKPNEKTDTTDHLSLTPVMTPTVSVTRTNAISEMRMRA